MTTNVPEVIRAAIVQVCRDSFWYHDDVRAIFVSSGVPDAVWDKHRQDGASKPKIARAVLNELRNLGPRGEAAQRRIVQELCLLTHPHPDVLDAKRGQTALDDLRRLATDLAIPQGIGSTKDQQRRDAAAQRQRAQQMRVAKLGLLKDEFFEHLKERPRTLAERQSRGYALEEILARLFELDDITYRRPYRMTHEQVDGSFHFRGFTYIVEAKWEKDPPTFGDLVKFKANVDGKLESTRGLFVSMAGYDDNALEHLLNVTRNSRNNLVLADGQDLIAIFEGRIALLDALATKIDAAEQEGDAWRPLGR